MRTVTHVLLLATVARAGSLMAATSATTPSPVLTASAITPQINASDFAQFEQTFSSDAFGGPNAGTDLLDGGKAAGK